MGLRDMTGNVWEWCFDWFIRYETKTDDRGIRGSSDFSVPRSNRGSSFDDDAAYSRIAVRGTNTPKTRLPTVGVRPAKLVTF